MLVLQSKYIHNCGSVVGQIASVRPTLLFVLDAVQLYGWVMQGDVELLAHCEPMCYMRHLLWGCVQLIV